MSTKQNKAIVCRFIDEAYNKRNLTVGDELLAANVVLHVSNSDIKGLEGWKQYAGSFLDGFSEIVISVKDTIAEGDKVVTRWTGHGTHKGELAGIPATGKSATVTGMGVDRIVNGKIVESWGIFDQFGMMQQLGVIPAAG